ncbi:MAG TPA: hypothetical protein VGD56_06380 [Gemmatirosa sp.]
MGATAHAFDGMPVGVPTALLVATVLARRWRRVVAVALATSIAAAAYTAIAPKSYVASTLLVPFAGSTSSSLATTGLPSGVAGLLGSVGSSPAERLLSAVMNSGRLFDAVLHAAAHGPEDMRVVGGVMRKGVRFVRNPDGSLTVQVSAPSPEVAARIANTYPPVLNAVLARLSAEGAEVKKQYLRTQLDTADEHLTASERRFVDFAQRRTAPAPDQQAQRTIDAAANLQQQIFEQEASIAQLRRTATEDNPELRAANALLATRRAQLRELTNGAGGQHSVLVPVERGPELRVASTRVEREYQQDLHVYASLAAEVANAEIDESNSLPVLTVLDLAQTPSDPTLTAWAAAALGLAVGLVLGVIAALLSEGYARLRAQPDAAPYFEALGRRAPRTPTVGGPA